MVNKLEHQFAGQARTYIEAGYAIEVDILQVADGSWAAFIRLSKLADAHLPAMHFMLNVRESHHGVFIHAGADTRVRVTVRTRRRGYYRGLRQGRQGRHIGSIPGAIS